MALTQPFPSESPRNNSLFSVPHAEDLELTTSGMLVRPEVLSELDVLRHAQIDAEIVDVAPRYQLPTFVQEEVDKQSVALGQMDRETARATLFDPTVHSAGETWEKLSKRAIALLALKNAGNPESTAIAPGIDPAVYDEKLFDGLSAREIMYKEHPRSAAMVMQRYEDITTQQLEDKPYSGSVQGSRYMTFVNEQGFVPLHSKDFLTGVVDSRAVDTRATAAFDIAIDHLIKNETSFGSRPLVTASLACGAAAPMYEFNQMLEERGFTVGKNILVDNDPMALASAVSLGRTYGMSDKVDAQLKDIVGGKLTDFIEPHSVDVVDILGIVDYLPTNIKGYHAAANFIGKIVDIVRPGGIIVAGNALLSRPHQGFFTNVWPKLEQRDPLEMIDIIEQAGYDIEKTIVRVPQREGVYGVYGIPVTGEDVERGFKEARSQRAARRILQFLSNFNKY